MLHGGRPVAVVEPPGTPRHPSLSLSDLSSRPPTSRQHVTEGTTRPATPRPFLVCFNLLEWTTRAPVLPQTRCRAAPRSISLAMDSAVRSCFIEQLAGDATALYHSASRPYSDSQSIPKRSLRPEGPAAPPPTPNGWT
jgi:hypothetical protein